MNNRINEIKIRLKELETEKENLLKELEQISQKTINNNTPELTAEEKIKLFRFLFKGRDDIYARKWENKEKSGYSPTKAYNGNYLPINDEIIKYHLQGINPKEPLYYGQKRDFIIGIYPLLKK